jgi:hypothetical protein
MFQPTILVVAPRDEAKHKIEDIEFADVLLLVFTSGIEYIETPLIAAREPLLSPEQTPLGQAVPPLSIPRKMFILAAAADRVTVEYWAPEPNGRFGFCNQTAIGKKLERCGKLDH